MGESKDKGKDLKPDSADKDDSRTTVFKENDDAGNQMELATDAPASATEASDPTLTSLRAATVKLKEDIAS